MRTFKVTLTEEELKAVINHNIFNVFDYSSERSSRIHELTKKLNKNIETEDKAEEQQPEIGEGQAVTGQQNVGGW